MKSFSDFPTKGAEVSQQAVERTVRCRFWHAPCRNAAAGQEPRGTLLRRRTDQGSMLYVHPRMGGQPPGTRRHHQGNYGQSIIGVVYVVSSQKGHRFDLVDEMQIECRDLTNPRELGRRSYPSFFHPHPPIL